MDKVIRDGKVAVLYSPGFGAGWSTWSRGGGGGGAGAAGSNAVIGAGLRAPGGYGVQLDPTFRDPSALWSDPGTYGGGTAPTPGGYWVAGGGGGGMFPAGLGGYGGSGGGGEGSVSGSPIPTVFNAKMSTGGGGGGSGGPGNDGPVGGAGGSGIVLIAYPS